MSGVVISLKRPLDPLRMWKEFSPQIVGTIDIAVVSGSVALALALAASPRIAIRGLLLSALVSFLLGGQILAIALIRMYNRPWLDWVYDEWPIVVMAYIGRFGWIVLAAAAVTGSAAWRQIRDMAAIDGADSMQTARYVIWPLAWPILGASAFFVLILSLSEVPATVLLSPQRPQMLMPMLMTWVHMLRYDAMIEASLILAGIVVILGFAAVALAAMGARMHGKWKMEKGKWSRVVIFLFTFSICHVLSGCRDSDTPKAIWCNTGIGPGQVVYPRGIAYSATDDSFFIVDREARIQHLDRDGKCLAAWRMPQWAQGKPVGLTVGPDGDLYVPDTHYHRVLVYSAGGELLRQWGSRGTGPGQFIYPTDIAFDAKGNVFVSEYGDNDRIQVFDRDGKFLYQFGKFGNADGEFSRPQSMLIDGDNLYITDACNHRLLVFKTDGTFIRAMGGPGSNLGQFRFPYGLDMDSHGRLIVCEFGNNRVQTHRQGNRQRHRDVGRAGPRAGAVWRIRGASPWINMIASSPSMRRIIACRCLNFDLRQSHPRFRVAAAAGVSDRLADAAVVRALAVPIVLLGVRSLAGLGPVRRWVALGIRLLVLLLLVLIIGGARWQRENKVVEVMVLRDISESSANVQQFPDATLQSSIEKYLQHASDSQHKPGDDRIGLISFHSTSVIDAMPNSTLALDARAIRDAGHGTDAAAAIQLGLATMNKDAMHRLLLIWDGNQTSGDLDAALTAAAAQHVPIDVMPLDYDVKNEVLVERFIAPTWKRENEPFTIEVFLRSQNNKPVTGKLTVLHNNQPMDLDPATPGIQTTRTVTLPPGPHVERVTVPPLLGSDVIHQFHATFERRMRGADPGIKVPGLGGGYSDSK